MSFRHRPPSDSLVLDQGWEGQRPLAFGSTPRVRDERILLSALTGALSVLVKKSDGTALQQSFCDAVRGLGAESGLVARFVEPDPLRLEVVCSRGLPPECDAGCEPLHGDGFVPALIRETLEEGRAVLVENTRLLDQAAPDAPASSIACVPVTDSLTGAPLAVLFVQTDAHRAFGPEDVDWLVCYAVVLGQALTLQAPQPPRLQDPKAERPDAGIEIVGSSVATRRLIDTLDMFLPSTARPDAPPILVTGESGTGKELVARYVHHYSPKRGRGPFHACNCATLRGDLAETRLFGHLKGSFTSAVADAVGLFRAADKGVLFLDEIGEMPIDCQALLLRVIETRHVRPVGDTKEVPVDVQLVVATNRQLEKEVENGRFREDLWYRLNGLRVELAPLRDPSRIADVKTLLGYYLALHERLLKKKTLGLTPQAFRVLLQYSWPGNVRELNNVCMTLVTRTAPGESIGVESIALCRPEVLSGPKNPNPEAFLEDETVTWAEATRAFRKKLILDRLRRHGNAAAAAKSLGISEPTFYRQLAEARRRP